jgi:hypothetical protein
MMAPSRLLSRAAALLLLMAAVPAIASVTILPVATRVTELKDQIEVERELLGRFSAAAAQGVQATQLERTGRAALDSGAYLKGESDAITVAALQRLLAEFAAAERLRFNSTRALEARQRDGIKLIGVRVQFQAEIEQARALLYSIESARPFLFVEGLHLHPLAAFSPGDGELAGKLDVRIDVFGAPAPRRE